MNDLIEKLEMLRHTDFITYRAFKMYPDNYYNAVCHALIAHIDFSRDLMDQLMKLNMNTPPVIVIKKDEDDGL